MTTAAGTRCPYCGYEPLRINQDRQAFEDAEFVCDSAKGCGTFVYEARLRQYRRTL